MFRVCAPQTVIPVGLKDGDVLNSTGRVPLFSPGQTEYPGPRGPVAVRLGMEASEGLLMGRRQLQVRRCRGSVAFPSVVSSLHDPTRVHYSGDSGDSDGDGRERK